MVKDKIDAHPRKKLFIDILTVDVIAEQCIMDLIDNSVDSFIKNKIKDRREINITINSDLCEIYDNCGGIEKNFLKNHVFRFGSEHLNRNNPTLGMYGIGLKRSIFKMGIDITLETDDGNDYSLIEMNVREWENNTAEDDWSIPFETEKSNLKKKDKPYTRIKVTDLNPEIKEKFSLDTFKNERAKELRRVYCLTMRDNIDFIFNGNKLDHYKLIVPQDNDYTPSVQLGEYSGVEYKIICFIDPSKGTRSIDVVNERGWNIFCNKRLILSNDTSKTTGWRGKEDPGYLPRYHTIYNEFRGIVFMQANNPFDLPLKTAKSDLNTETKVYHHILEQMIKAAKPVIDYLSKKYDKEKQEEDDIEERMEADINEDFSPTMVDATEIKETSEFKAPEKKESTKQKTTSISYSKPKKLVEEVKTRLGATSNKDVGSLTFDYYVDLEEIDE